MIALCTSRIYGQQEYQFIEAFNEQLKKHGMTLCVFSITSDLYWVEDEDSAESHVFHFIPYDKTELVVIMDEKIKSHRIAGDIIRAARAHGKPVIVLDGSYPDCLSIRFDYASGFETVVRHMFEAHVIRRPHFMAGIKDNPFSDERIRIFRKILEEKGMPFDESMVSYGDFWAEPAREATRELLKRDVLPDAILCANDIMAINVCAVLKTAGIGIPDQVLVSGFDGFDETFFASPGITTAGCDLAELARITADMILQCLRENRFSGEKLVLPRLMPNESCGCPRCTKGLSSSLNRFNNSFYRYQDDARVMRRTITAMTIAETDEEMVRCLAGPYTTHVSCVVNEKCFCPEEDFFSLEDPGEKYCLLYDSAEPDAGRTPFDTGELLPRMEERLSGGFPILVQSLDYMNRSMGYICYFFEDFDITDYVKTVSITEMFGMGLGGYITMQMHRYLTHRMEDMYRLDALTGLYNRQAFRQVFDAMIQAPENQGKPLLVVMTDLDHLKRINDTLGHAAGDQAIAAAASALREASPEEALCVRFGGDEMLGFIPGVTDAGEILGQMEAYLKRASAACGFAITASSGYHLTVIDQNISIKRLIAEVDEKMYSIKRARHERRQDENI